MERWQSQNLSVGLCASKTSRLTCALGELRKAGVKLKLGGQPFQVLTILLERPGQVVTREELQKQLWPDIFVDVDQSQHRNQQDSRGAGRFGGESALCRNPASAGISVYWCTGAKRGGF